MPDIQTQCDLKAPVMQVVTQSWGLIQMVTAKDVASCLSGKARDASKSLKGLAKESMARFMQEEVIL